MDYEEMIEFIGDAMDVLEGYCDINDYGGPNDAMQAMEKLQNVIDILKRQMKEGR